MHEEMPAEIRLGIAFGKHVQHQVDRFTVILVNYKRNRSDSCMVWVHKGKGEILLGLRACNQLKDLLASRSQMNIGLSI